MHRNGHGVLCELLQHSYFVCLHVARDRCRNVLFTQALSLTTWAIDLPVWTVVRLDILGNADSSGPSD